METRQFRVSDVLNNYESLLSLLDTVREAWGWTGLDPLEVFSFNLFGNLIVRASDGSYWRICPEEWSCDRIALDAATFVELSQSREFQADWAMLSLVDSAREQLGSPSDGQCYCHTLPAIVGGKYKCRRKV